jgi:CRP-like cAMP-binding protein
VLLVLFFQIKKNGNEYIATLFVPDRIIGSLSALILSEKSMLTYDCLTKCEVYIANYKDFMEATKDDIYLSLMYVKFLEYAFIKMENKTHQLSNLNATERYLSLKQDITDVENLIPQYHIASYLNITPVQLSRIRKEILSK